jgi:hypothetical protein
MTEIARAGGVTATVIYDHLPHIDEHAVMIEAGATDVWSAFGRGFRALLIGTGGHVVIVRRLLTAVRRRAERSE